MEIIILPCLTVACVLILSYYTYYTEQKFFHIINLEHMKTYLQTNKKDRTHKGISWMQAMLLHFQEDFLITTQLKTVRIVPNQKNKWTFQHFAEELIYLCNTVSSYRQYHLFLLLERIPCIY